MKRMDSAATATVSILDGTRIFADGFESGDTSEWADTEGRTG
jgi:hypothetical protein